MPFTPRALAILLAALAAGSAWAQSAISAAELVQTLRGGGYVIVFRHGGTYADQADTVLQSKLPMAYA